MVFDIFSGLKTVDRARYIAARCRRHRAFIRAVRQAHERWRKMLGRPEFMPDLRQRIIAGIHRVGSHGVAARGEQRDSALTSLLKLRN